MIKLYEIVKKILFLENSTPHLFVIGPDGKLMTVFKYHGEVIEKNYPEIYNVLLKHYKDNVNDLDADIMVGSEYFYYYMLMNGFIRGGGSPNVMWLNLTKQPTDQQIDTLLTIYNKQQVHIEVMNERNPREQFFYKFNTDEFITHLYDFVEYIKNNHNKSLEESPDQFINRDGHATVYYNKDYITFGYDGNILLFAPNKTHFGLTMNRDTNYSDLVTPGRVWPQQRIVSFWKYPNSSSDVKNILNKIKKKYREIGNVEQYFVEIPAYYDSWEEFYSETSMEDLAAKLNKNNLDTVLVPINKFDGSRL